MPVKMSPLPPVAIPGFPESFRNVRAPSVICELAPFRTTTQSFIFAKVREFFRCAGTSYAGELGINRKNSPG